MQRALCVGDLPFGTYESSVSKCIETSVRVLKEGVMDAVKIEGGNHNKIELIKGETDRDFLPPCSRSTTSHFSGAPAQNPFGGVV